MVRKNRTTNAIRGLNEADLIVGAVGIAAGIAAFFTGGTSIAAYAAFVADIAGVMGSAGGIASGSLQVQQGKTTGNKKEVREGIESIGFGIGGLASMGMGYASTKYFSGNPWLRSAIRGASAALDVGMMATGTALTIKSDVTGNGGIGLKASNWQGDLALAESVMGIGMFGVQSYNAYNEYSIQVKANTGISDAPIGVRSRSDSEILKNR